MGNVAFDIHVRKDLGTARVDLRMQSGSGITVLFGPSGAGKSTLVRELLKSTDLPLEISVSATTRAPRTGEIDGVHYHFLSPEQFASLKKQGVEFFDLGTAGILRD